MPPIDRSLCNDCRYTEYNPERLADLDALLAKYGEKRLLSMLRKKYQLAEEPDSAVGRRQRRQVKPALLIYHRHVLPMFLTIIDMLLSTLLGTARVRWSRGC